jgi:hypothetical protein
VTEQFLKCQRRTVHVPRCLFDLVVFSAIKRPAAGPEQYNHFENPGKEFGHAVTQRIDHGNPGFAIGIRMRKWRNR